jgi:N-acetyl-gamma-glutamyl-phosphate reductase
MIRVGIIGGTSYTGEESMKILLRHPQAKVTVVTTRQETCEAVGDMFPSLRNRTDLKTEQMDLDSFAKRVDVAFCCLPHHVSMGIIPSLLKVGLKVVDFSADYRIRDAAVYEKYYGKHTDLENLAHAGFGLPELFRASLPGKQLIANPGCFPTGASLALAPVLARGIVQTDQIIINSVTGVSGAGRKAVLMYHLPEMNENIFPYAPGGTHRHSPEIRQICSDVAQKPVNILFQPHVVAIDRGILTTTYSKPIKSVTSQELLDLYREFYANEPFIRVLKAPPAMKAVAHSNFCDIFPTVSADGETIIVFSAIDNLIKGASGQAVQNMNIMFGLKESEGLL